MATFQHNLAKSVPECRAILGFVAARHIGGDGSDMQF